MPYQFYNFTKNSHEIITVKDETHLNIVIQSIKHGDLSWLTDMFSHNPYYIKEFIQLRTLMDLQPKYKNKRAKRMKIDAIKYQFFESWIVQFAVKKRTAIRLINHLVVKYFKFRENEIARIRKIQLAKIVKIIKQNWIPYKNKEWMEWRYFNCKGVMRFNTEFSRKWYLKNKRNPYNIVRI